MKPRPLFALLLSLFIPAIANAQWSANGLPVSALQNDQRYITMCSDGSGGVIIAWGDYRVDPVSDIYAQRINSAGVPLWTANGIVVSNGVSAQYNPLICTDGAGGAIITWQDNRNGTHDIFAQRINGSGTPLWLANGVVVCNAAADQLEPKPVSDGVGGAIIVWYDYRTPTNAIDLYAQRVNSAGVSQWLANGFPVCAAAQDQFGPQITTDGAQGAIIAWRDARNAGIGDVYAQRILSNGSTSWTFNGAPICTAVGEQFVSQVVTDGAGGAIIGWADRRNGNDYDLYAQRISGGGNTLWNANGVAICTMPNEQSAMALLPDGSQGAYFAWTDGRNGPSYDVFAQRVGGGGNVLWAPQGIAVGTTADSEQDTHLTSDGSNGVMVVFLVGASTPANSGIRAQRLDANGTPFWATNGVQVSTSIFGFPFQTAAIADPSGNALVAWYSFPGVGDANVYATRIENRYGYWGKPEPTLFAAKDVPNDQGGKVRLEWYASSRDQLNQQAITKYTIWRGIDQALYASAVAAGVPEVKSTDALSSFSGKAVRRDKPQGVDYFWELIGTQTAAYRSAYSFNAGTTFDSTATNSATHRFQILAHAAGDLINWPSNILTGRSVDNIAPPAPLFLTAQRIGNYVYLKWNGVHVPDLDKYTVYRKTSTGVTPIPANFLADNPDTTLTDSSAPTSALYYIVTATDIHQNQGTKSNEASVAAATGVGGDVPSITTLTVLQNHPNPFKGETSLQVGLPAKSDVSVEIYDVAGRRVRTARMPGQAKGWNTLRLAALDDRGAALPSGVYFFRVHAGTQTVTRKMVIAR